ncbi:MULTISPECIES: TilS substrate-binding domain-containing protein [unclassified Novosphingobium]|nr:TilS substrate-binding domain-containing protein [Novosphingobium sp. ES2-1]
MSPASTPRRRHACRRWLSRCGASPHSDHGSWVR